MMCFLQQSAHCADFDVVVDGESVPSFRLLLPEHLACEESGHGGVHTVPGRWEIEEGAAEGSFEVGGEFRVAVAIEAFPCGDRAACELKAVLQVTNLTERAVHNLTSEICASVNHLPGEPGWSNRTFLPESVPLDRDAQGEYWYEKVTPGGLLMLTADGWLPMHPSPEQPDASLVPRYSFSRSDAAEAWGCAVASPDGRELFYLAPDAQSFWHTPCPGNACMHLSPVVAKSLAPGATATVSLLAGLYSETRDLLGKKIARFRECLC